VISIVYIYDGLHLDITLWHPHEACLLDGCSTYAKLAVIWWWDEAIQFSSAQLESSSTASHMMPYVSTPCYACCLYTSYICTVVMCWNLSCFNHALVLHSCCRFRHGLHVGGVWRSVERAGDDWLQVFTAQLNGPVSAEQLLELFKPTLSPTGSNRRTRETTTIAFWRDWVVELES